MRLPNSTYEFIKGEVANVYRQQNIRSFPVCANKLAKDMGFKVVPYSELDPDAYKEAMGVSSDGFYAERDWKEYIFINDSEEIGNARKRMTIFHEIGHPVLGHDDSMSDDEKESEAKFFGKYLAAPPVAIHLLTNGTESDMQRIFVLSDDATRIASEYYTSWKAKVRRSGLAEYDIIILNQLGVVSVNQIRRFIESVKADEVYEK